MGKWIYWKIKYLFSCFIDIIYGSEEGCYICKCTLENRDYICENCYIYLPHLKNTTMNYNLQLKSVYSLFSYEEKVKEMIHDLKYNRKHYLSDVIGSIMAEFIKQNNIKIDYIVPIPMHPDKLKERGYNHSYLIAKKIEEILNIKVKNCLIKTRNTKSQVLLNRDERWYNVKGSIKSNFKLKNKNILLIDDVVTTGATGHFSALALKGNNVSLLSFATSR